jgi:hypothetical protein
MSLTKLFQAGNNLLFPASRLGTGKSLTFFYSACTVPWACQGASPGRTARPWTACWTRGSRTTWSPAAPDRYQPNKFGKIRTSSNRYNYTTGHFASLTFGLLLPNVIKKGYFIGYFFVLYSTLRHLPLHAVHCVQGCRDWTKDALTICLDLIPLTSFKFTHLISK